MLRCVVQVGVYLNVSVRTSICQYGMRQVLHRTIIKVYNATWLELGVIKNVGSIDDCQTVWDQGGTLVDADRRFRLAFEASFIHHDAFG